MALGVFSKQSVCLIVSVGTFLAGAVGMSASGKVSYADVQSIFTAHCTRCHGADEPSAGLSLSSCAGTMKGGVSGKVAVAGKPDDSLLMARILGKGGKPQMPMGFTAISSRELEVIRTWIAEGCSSSTAPSKTHWAYVAPTRPAIPRVSDPRWVRNPIDSFVLARLDREHLKPSTEADKTTLMRRVTLDLTGLPPTPT